LTRIYEEARNKVATAFVEGRDLLFKGGDIYFDKNWFKCNNCNASFSHYDEKNPVCPVCNSNDVIQLNEFYSG
jgi:rubrerythrin